MTRYWIINGGMCLTLLVFGRLAWGRLGTSGRRYVFKSSAIRRMRAPTTAVAAVALTYLYWPIANPERQLGFLVPVLVGLSGAEVISFVVLSTIDVLKGGPGV